MTGRVFLLSTDVRQVGVLVPASNAGTWQAEACVLPGLSEPSLLQARLSTILLRAARQVTVKRAGKIRLNMANREDKQRSPGVPKSTLRIYMRLVLSRR